eukprot:7358745-Pyramimonas_sp.AAC.1
MDRSAKHAATIIITQIRRRQKRRSYGDRLGSPPTSSTTMVAGFPGNEPQLPIGEETLTWRAG